MTLIDKLDKWHDYKAYSLQEVETWLRESLEADCTPQEIYDSVIETVKNNMKYHRACYRDSVRLLSLLRGNKNELEVHETFGETIFKDEEININLDNYENETTTVPYNTGEVIVEDITIETDK